MRFLILESGSGMNKMKIVTLPVPESQNGFYHQTLWQSAWGSIKKRPDAIFSIVVILLFVLVAVFAKYLAPYPQMEGHFGFADLPPFWVKDSIIHATGDLHFLLGTDTLGRDLLSWGIYGTRTSIFLGFLSAPLIAFAGTLYGLISGYASQKIDNFLMRIADIFYAFPTIMIYIIIVLALHSTPVGKIWGGMLMMFLAVLSVGWVGIARLVRSSVLTIKNQEFIEAARSIGARPYRIIVNHILPNIFSTIIVWFTYMIPQIILVESILGYLGIGISSADQYAFFGVSWGGLFYIGRGVLRLQPVITIMPAIGLILISLAFSFLGDALRDAFDPHNQARYSALNDGKSGRKVKLGA
jgi:ABC-type dipeptide/oligopeptide/nickel transport system permease subunit